jgi:glycosyltransferase involved in cell wall biosynthesis
MMPHNYRVAMVGACPFPTSQGSQVLIRQLSEALAAHGHSVHIVSYHLGEAAPPPMPAVRVHRIPRVPGYRKIGSGPAWGKLLLDPLLLLTLARVVRRERIDIIHAHNYEALLVSWLVGRATGRPVVYHSHNIMAAELPTYFSNAPSRRLAGWLARLLDTQLPRRANLSIALSPDAVPFFRSWGVPKERIRLIPPGIDFEDPADCDPALVRQQHNLDDGPLAIYTGNLDQYQRLGLLLRSFQRVRVALPTSQLLIASHSPSAQYRALIERVGPSPGVKFVHCHDFGETQALLASADVAICPRVACFGFPIKLLNYMAAGKAVVVAQGSAKGIRHLENGYVVSDGEQALAEGVIHMLRDPVLGRRLGAAARATVEGRFRWTHVVREIERCYDDLTSKATEPILIDGPLSSN